MTNKEAVAKLQAAGDIAIAAGCELAKIPAMDVLAIADLLTEQEPVKPERECSGGGTTWWNVCGACRTAINPNDKYCHECGRGINWNAAD